MYLQISRRKKEEGRRKKEECLYSKLYCQARVRIWVSPKPALSAESQWLQPA
ncbi:MAG: hypothetical protein QQW96_05300 [Tychonema bourrellyi B0820]|nr:hypothetical protein [Tychonema bourrellyi B0820]